MAAPDFGLDLELADGFQPHFPTVSGHRNLLLQIFRRLSTSSADECGEIYAGRCMDARELFAAKLDPQQLGGVERQVEAVCRYDERIDSATCRAAMDSARKLLTLSVNLVPAEGPSFDLVLAVDGVTVELLNGD